MYTISRDYRKEIVIEKSRFICSLKKVHSEAEAQEFIKAVKKEFWDATHNCSAYIVDDLAQRSSDDGEPSGTAGIPMLEVLRKNGLTETAAVVTRYFGGIKLGIPGLIRAYKTSTEDALSSATIVEKTATEIFRLDFDYLQMNNVMKILKDLKAEILSRDFGTGCTVTAQVRLSLEEDFLSRISDIENCSVEKPVPVQDSVETGDIQN